MTSLGKFAKLVAAVPVDVKKLTEVVQGLVIHEFVSIPFYGFEPTEERKLESHIRPIAMLVEKIIELDDRPLSVERKPEKRLVGVCRHFATLLVAMLRAKGIPARSRYGFGAYFNPGYFEDHSLVEYWNEKAGRWMRVDPQFDSVWRRNTGIRHDVLDVPRDQFIVASDAWTACRTGRADPMKFGIAVGDLRGLWFIADVLIRDVASLNKMEMLQWDGWGPMPRPGSSLQDKRKLAFFDKLAELTRDPDASFKELRSMYADPENRLAVPERVFNAVHGHLESV
jgi:hypothetical protein